MFVEVIFDDGRKTNDPVLAIRMLVTSPVNAGSRTSARFVHGQVSSASIPVSTATSIHKIARGYAACWAVQRRARGGGRDQFRLANTFVASLPFISSVLWLTSSPRPHTYYPPPPPPQGSREGSWNHSVRLQRKLGLRLRVLALIDPDLDRANKRIKEQTQVLPTAWTDTRAFPDAASAAQALEGANIRLIINGTPPFLRGTMQPGADLDKTLLQAFPSAKAMLIEKPVAALPPTEGGRAELVQLMKEHNRVVGVGYMLRYLKGALLDASHSLCAYT